MHNPQNFRSQEVCRDNKISIATISPYWFSLNCSRMYPTTPAGVGVHAENVCTYPNLNKKRY